MLIIVRLINAIFLFFSFNTCTYGGAVSTISRTFQLKLPPGVRQNAQARFAFNTNGNHFAAVLELPGSAVVQSIFDMQGQHLSSGSQSKLMLLSLTTCYDPYNNLLWNYSPVWHAAIKWTTHPTKVKNPSSVALATADTIIYRQLSLPGAPADGTFLSIAMKLVAVAESKAVGLQDEWMTPGVARKAARLFEYVCTTLIEKSLEPDAPAASPVMHFIASACIRSLRLLLRYGAILSSVCLSTLWLTSAHQCPLAVRASDSSRSLLCC